MNEKGPIFSFGDLTLNRDSRLAARQGRSILLTAKEYDLLELFMRHPNQVLKRGLIFDQIWGYDFMGESNVLDVYIRYLREKIEIQGTPRLIQTVRGVGYRLGS